MAVTSATPQSPPPANASPAPEAKAPEPAPGEVAEPPPEAPAEPPPKPKPQSWLDRVKSQRRQSSPPPAPKVPKSIVERYGTTNPEQARQLQWMESEYEKWKARLAAGPLTDVEKAEHANFRSEYKRLYETSLKEDQLGSVKGRAALQLLKARVGSQSTMVLWNTERESAGMFTAGRKVGIRIIQSTGGAVGEAAHSPMFWAMVFFQGREIAINLGETLTDDTLSRLQKFEHATFDLAKMVFEAKVAFKVYEVAVRLFPNAVKIADGATLAFALKGLASGEYAEDLCKEIAHLKGYKGPLAAAREWQELGIPEAGYLKVDPTLDKPSSGLIRAIGMYESTNDVDILTADRGDMISPRIQYWANDPQSPFLVRLRQLCGVGPNDPPPAEPPKNLDPSKVTSFHEPVYPTVGFLQQLGTLNTRKDRAALAQVDAAKGFDFAAWQKGVAGAGVIGPGLKVDEARLASLLKANDRFSALQPAQQTLLERRIETEVTQIARWAAVLDQMSISPEDKRAALAQLVENTAANHLANSILFDYANRTDSDGLLDPKTEIDDYYTSVRQVMR
jgi:hypothetical protein